MTFYSVTLAWTIRLPDGGPRTEICRSVFNVLMCKFYKFYICAVVGIITLVNRQNVSVTKIADPSSIQRAETKYGLRIQFLDLVFMIHEV